MFDFYLYAQMFVFLLVIAFLLVDNCNRNSMILGMQFNKLLKHQLNYEECRCYKLHKHAKSTDLSSGAGPPSPGSPIPSLRLPSTRTMVYRLVSENLRLGMAEPNLSSSGGSSVSPSLLCKRMCIGKGEWAGMSLP